MRKYIVFLLLLSIFISCNDAYNKNITASKITSVKVGMSIAKVFSILGKPLKIESKNSNRTRTFTYTEVPKYTKTYPMLWVHFDEDEKVRQVFAKKYILWGVDDECIYIQDSTFMKQKPDLRQLKQMFK